MRKLLKVMRGERGFTLIELLVVIGILAALAGVVTLAVTQFIGRGCLESASVERHNVQTAVAACMVDYPIASCQDQGSAELVNFFIDTPNGTYTVDENGRVTQNTYPPCVP